MTYLDTLMADKGRWQFVLLCIASVSVMNLAPSHLEITFFAPQQKHWCNLPLNVSSSGFNVSDITDSDSCEVTFIITEDGAEIVKDKDNYNETTEFYTHKCQSWSYDHSVWKRTIVEDWNLVCKRDVLISTSSFVYMTGMMLGVSIFGQLADKYGRRLIATVSTVLWMIVSFITAFSTNYIMFVIMRFLMASAAVGSMTITYVWCIESMSSKIRAIGGTTISIIWCIGMLMSTLVPYITRDWRYSQIVFAGLIALYFPICWFTVESPSWLFSIGKFDEGMKALTSAAKMNKKLEPDREIIKQDLERDNEVSEDTSATFFDLLKYPNLRKKTLILYYNWFVVSFIYFALTLNTGNLGSDVFINMTIASILEAIGYVIAILLLVKVGRRLPTAISFVIGGVCCFLVAFIPDGGPELTWAKVSIALVGRTAISISFNNLFVYTSELHPTVVRTIGLGSSSFVARIGGMLAPYVKELGKYTNSSVPMILFGVLSTTSGGVCFLLPETKDKALPNSLEEGEAFGRTPANENKSNGLWNGMKKTLRISKKPDKDVDMNELA